MTRRYIPAHVEDFILEQCEIGRTTAQILHAQENSAAISENDRASRSTIRRIRKEFLESKDNDDWDWINDADIENPIYALSALRELIDRSNDPEARLTRQEARIITRIADALPGAHPWELYRLAGAYIKRSHSGTTTTDLDFLISLASNWLKDGVSEIQVSRQRDAYVERQSQLFPNLPPHPFLTPNERANVDEGGFVSLSKGWTKKISYSISAKELEQLTNKDVSDGIAFNG